MGTSVPNVPWSYNFAGNYWLRHMPTGQAPYPALYRPGLSQPDGSLWGFAGLPANKSNPNPDPTIHVLSPDRQTWTQVANSDQGPQQPPPDLAAYSWTFTPDNSGIIVVGGDNNGLQETVYHFDLVGNEGWTL